MMDIPFIFTIIRGIPLSKRNKTRGDCKLDYCGDSKESIICLRFCFLDALSLVKNGRTLFI